MSADRSLPAPAGQPIFEVRNEGELWKRVSKKGAKELVDMEWAEWRESKGRPYLALTEKAPVSSIVGWRGKTNTRPVRADSSCRNHAPGQAIGNRRFNLEFRG